MDTIKYIISFLLYEDKSLESLIYYGKKDNAINNAKIIIVQSDFFSEVDYNPIEILPKTPFQKLPNSNIPFLFGDNKIEYVKNSAGQDIIILYADLVASAYYLMSRYEEIIKTDCRDQYGRFLAKDSIIFQQGYGMRPLVDEWGRYLRSLLRQLGVYISEEKEGFRKIYLTHDVDNPFLMYRKDQVIKQWIKNLIHYGNRIKRPLYIYNHPDSDPYNTFGKIIEHDVFLTKKYGTDLVESIYFLIAAGSQKTKKYCNIKLKKYQDLITKLNKSGASLGLHVSYEAGTNPLLIKQEIERLLNNCKYSCTKSRHHFLHWIEPEHIEQMEQAGITEDFTLEYADSVGFRVGTCRPYYFINPRTKRVTNVLVHPMQIMDCSLDRVSYMGLGYEDAFNLCKKLINTTYEFNGELVLLFHNPIWSEENYYGHLYEQLLEYLSKNADK